MTPTEERLADALDSVAASIPDESLRALPAVRSSTAGRRRHGWLVPMAASGAVLAVAVLAASITWPAHVTPVTHFRDSATPTTPPPYYVTITSDDGDVLQVHTTSGYDEAATDVVSPPRGWHATGAAAFYQAFAPAALASEGDREFVVAYNNPATRLTGLFVFGLTRSGKVTGFRLAHGGVLPGVTNPVLAISPDGSQVAVAGTPDPNPLNGFYNAVDPATIVIVDLRTGAHHIWQGGMNRPGWQFSIPSVSWAPDGQSLVYVAQWCRPRLDVPDTASCGLGNRGAAVRVTGPSTLVEEISPVGAGGRLDAGHVLMRGSVRYPKILQAVMAPDGDLLALVANRTHPYLLQIAEPSGRLQRVLYNGHYIAGITISLGLSSAQLSSDASGRYFIISVNGGVPTGWVGGGRYHYVGQANAWSTAW